MSLVLKLTANAWQLGEGASEALDLCGCLALLPNCLLAVRSFSFGFQIKIVNKLNFIKWKK
jgi:hypothetical protein